VATSGAILLRTYLRTRSFDARVRTPAGVARWQERRARRFLPGVVAASPFYRDHLAGCGVDDWRSWPIVDKGMLMAAFDRWTTCGLRLADALAVAEGAERSRDFAPLLGDVAVGLSSGTSGRRGVFVAGAQERAAWAGAVLARTLPGSILARHRVAFFLRANSRLYEAVGSRRLRFRFFDLCEPFESHLSPLATLDPTVLVGPPSLLVALADEASEGRLRIGPRKVISVAETLEPPDEARIRAAFGAPVHQIYQATEGFLAATCRHGTLHVNEDIVAIEPEWLDGAGIDVAGGRGRAAMVMHAGDDRPRTHFTPIVTDLHRTTQPVIRYRLDDVLVAAPRACPCGSPRRALAAVDGRRDDVFIGEGAVGRVPVFADALRRAFVVAAPEAVGWRAVQTAAGRIELAIEPLGAGGRAAEGLRAAFIDAGARPPDVEVRPLGPERPGPDKRRRLVRAWSVDAA